MSPIYKYVLFKINVIKLLSNNLILWIPIDGAGDRQLH